MSSSASASRLIACTAISHRVHRSALHNGSRFSREGPLLTSTGSEAAEPRRPVSLPGLSRVRARAAAISGRTGLRLLQPQVSQPSSSLLECPHRHEVFVADGADIIGREFDERLSPSRGANELDFKPVTAPATR